MMRRAEPVGEAADAERRGRGGYKGVRRRRWGKWVSEIRVPGTRERLWLGSYATPEAAAVAHDTAVYFLRGGTGAGAGTGAGVAGGGDVAALNFPERAAAAYGTGAGAGAAGRLSPRSVQRVASDAGMAADAQLVAARESAPAPALAHAHRTGIGIGSAHDGGASAHARPGAGREQPAVSGEINVDDMEILM
ncbi:hypothetical protein BDA96_03G411600 [Sorghum bicolor]|jgi:hypothetical protein|uniref:AP2/ERF domain-containing protein n=2 Tax=Sorghum bicolor TaxID=4558 RepID=A0A921RHN2_SORBI|nr:ethylene-responsive transcription factor ERF020 [Sorghum bicolor]KAG0540466.1 hypothetical protein BDA96_03G411600 [Sorghum bicolor]KXG33837.1 hypothetical protein SORBI_3003G380900 [Sorghum bicolor]|eukprot:XP_002456757.2 ethylene-responsive transcription factor ERF020 [Sorghum bicolor]